LRQHHAEELDQQLPLMDELAANNPLVREVKVRCEEFPELGLLSNRRLASCAGYNTAEDRLSTLLPEHQQDAVARLVSFCGTAASFSHPCQRQPEGTGKK